MSYGLHTSQRDHIQANSQHRNTYRSILLYLLFSFLIPLICITLMKLCPVFQSTTCNLILFGMEAASPAIAVLLVWTIHGGLAEVSFELHKRYIDHFSIKYNILAIIIPLTILMLSKLTIVCIHPGETFLYPITAKKLLIVSWALVAEELGWRGFLQEKLDSMFPHTLVPIAVGIIWALWHYHFILSGSMSIPLLAFLLGCIFESYGYYTITRLANGNVIPASLWHFTGNLFFNLFRFDPSWNNGSNEMYWISTVFYSLCVVVFVVSFKKVKR